ncbi:MAG: glycosyltransferase [Bacteroidales bacterium]|nr:glycosyltransferase [Bacteroidales bacterium]
MMKVLFLSAWYPNKYDAMSGLFVRKHAEAVSKCCDVKVLYVHPDKSLNDFQISVSVENGITEIFIYYPVNLLGTENMLTKFYNYLKAYHIGFKIVHESGFSPDIVHANILTRTGFIAYLYKIWKKVPYVITEHWSRYLPIRNSYRGLFRKTLTKLVVKNAQAVFPVSENLRTAMLNHKLKNPNYTVISNSVDPCFANEIKPQPRIKKRMLHVSCFDELAKNVRGILNATYELSKKRTDFELVLVGNGIDFDEIYQYAQSLNFEPGILKFTGEKTPSEVAEWFYNSDFFVLFSNYENSPVVVAESLFCGKPLISTNVGGISEHVNSTNGILIPAGDENALIQNMDYMLDHFQEYNSEEIKAAARQKFSMESIGNLLSEQYKHCVK